MVCKAKTGTGKTLSFLIPAVERILAGQAAGSLQQGGVAALIMSPSRELAMQIQAEAEQLLRFHTIKAQVCDTSISLLKSGKAQTQGSQLHKCTPFLLDWPLYGWNVSVNILSWTPPPHAALL